MSRFGIVHAERVRYPVKVLCSLLRVSTSGYYAWCRRSRSTRARDDERLVTKMRAIQARVGGVYGSPRMVEELRADGELVGVNRIARLMRDYNLLARQRRRFRATTDSTHSLPVAPNLLARDFAWSEPNRAWVGDITYIKTDAGWAYLAVLLDLFSRRVVGWAISDSLGREVAIKALRNAVTARRPEPGLIHHTDRGSQYASAEYRGILIKSQVAQSMSRAGDCFDNAVAESFFASLKKERIWGRRLATLTEAHDVVADYIDGFYNPVRRHSTLAWVSPINYETESRRQLAA